MQDLSTLGGTHSEAYAINASGTVVGNSSTNGDVSMHAFLKPAGGPMQDWAPWGALIASLMTSTAAARWRDIHG